MRHKFDESYVRQIRPDLVAENYTRAIKNIVNGEEDLYHTNNFHLLFKTNYGTERIRQTYLNQKQQETLDSLLKDKGIDVQSKTKIEVYELMGHEDFRMRVFEVYMKLWKDKVIPWEILWL